MLEKWERKDWVAYSIFIPLVLLTIFILPPSIKDNYLILYIDKPTLLSIFFNNYTHSTLSHLGNNIGLYLLTILAIFIVETDKQRMHITFLLLFCVLPFLSALPLFLLSSLIPPAQGFSAIGSGFLGYLIYASTKFLEKRHQIKGQNMLAIILSINIIMTRMLWDQVILISLIGTILVILTIVERKNVLKLIKYTFDYFKVIPKGAFIEVLRRYFTIVLPTVLCFSLPFLLPSVFYSDEGVLTNIISHYIGWVSGLFFPIIVDFLKK
jgi:hypothetical protein